MGPSLGCARPASRSVAWLSLYRGAYAQVWHQVAGCGRGSGTACAVGAVRADPGKALDLGGSRWGMSGATPCPLQITGRGLNAQGLVGAEYRLGSSVDSSPPAPPTTTTATTTTATTAATATATATALAEERMDVLVASWSSSSCSVANLIYGGRGLRGALVRSLYLCRSGRVRLCGRCRSFRCRRLVRGLWSCWSCE